MPRFSKRGWIVVGTVGLIAALASLWTYERHAHPLYPTPMIRAGTSPEQKAAAQALQDRSKTCSVPGLSPGVPRLVPGLEKIDKAWTLTLTDDLCTIVFSAQPAEDEPSCLFIANRQTVSSAFRNPVVIRACSSQAFDFRPALSPDGLELLFVRVDEGMHIFSSRRLSRSMDFSTPALWTAAEVASAGRRATLAQFLDPLHVLISVSGAEPKSPPSFFIAERTTLTSDFGPLQEVAMPGCNALGCVRPSRLIAYLGNSNGIFVQGRPSLDERFSRSRLLFGRNICGAVPTKIWLTRGDDVAFFCSAGPGKPPTDKNHLWMIRF